MGITDIVAIIGIFITFLALFVAIRTLKFTEKALEASEKALEVTEKALDVTTDNIRLSIYLQNRRETADRLTYFYYPLRECMANRDDFYQISDYPRDLLTIATQHMYLGKPGIVKDLKWLLSAGQKVDDKFKNVRNCVNYQISIETNNIEIWTKKIKELGACRFDSLIK